MNTKSSTTQETKIYVLAEKMTYNEYLKTHSIDHVPYDADNLNAQGYLIFGRCGGWVDDETFNELYHMVDSKYEYLVSVYHNSLGNAKIEVTGKNVSGILGILVRIYTHCPDSWDIVMDSSVSRPTYLRTDKPVTTSEIDLFISEILNRDIIEVKQQPC